MAIYVTAAETEIALGERLRALRLERNLEQETLAERAGLSRKAVKNLEAGRGTIRTLVAVLRVLGRDSWLDAVAPVPTINPLTLTAPGTQRQRARKRRPRAA